MKKEIYNFDTSSQGPGLPVQTQPTKPENPVASAPASKADNLIKSAVKIESDSDSPPVRRSGPVGFMSQAPVEEIEVSGPENELDDDDFWN